MHIICHSIAIVSASNHTEWTWAVSKVLFFNHYFYSIRCLELSQTPCVTVGITLLYFIFFNSLFSSLHAGEWIEKADHTFRLRAKPPYCKSHANLQSSDRQSRPLPLFLSFLPYGLPLFCSIRLYLNPWHPNVRVDVYGVGRKYMVGGVLGSTKAPILPAFW